MTDKSLTSSESGSSGARPVPGGGVGPTIFAGLVQAEDDTVGLLAYALYKQNKRDWLTSFIDDQGRDVAPGELLAYHLGERTPRRLLTYRRLAVDVLAKDPGSREGEGFAGNFTAMAAGGGKAAMSPPSFTDAIVARPWAKALVAILAVIGLLAIILAALSFVSPSLVRDMLPAPSMSSPAAPK